METRRQRRGNGKSAQAVPSDPPVRPPSPASESTAGNEKESEAESEDFRATGVRDRDPPTTTLPGDAYETPPAGAGAGTEGTQTEAPPSPVSLAPGGLATTGDDLSGPDVEGVDLAEATATAEAPDPGAGPPDTQAVEVPSHMRVEQFDSNKTTNPHTLDSDTTHSQTLVEHAQIQVETRTHTQVQEAHSLTLVPFEPGAREPRESGPPPTSRYDTV